MRINRVIILTALAMGIVRASTATAEDQTPVKIGAIFAVTGPAANLGAPEARTAEMLVETLNAKGGLLGRPVDKFNVRFGMFLGQTNILWI